MPTKTAKSEKLSKSELALATIERVGIDAICASVMTGASLTAISQEMKGVHHSHLIAWIQGNDDRAARVKDARTVASYHFADQALIEIELAHSKDEISRARELANHLRWLASKFNRDVFGSHQTIDATLNHNVQFLEALKQHGTTALPLPKVEVMIDNQTETVDD